MVTKDFVDPAESTAILGRSLPDPWLMLAKFGLFVCTLLALCCVSQAQNTIRVPADQPTIQAGINAANNGDTVLVASGTYNENINFNGKAITVTSLGTTGATASTILDGSAGQNATVSFTNGETRKSVLNGFTIQGGGSEVSGLASTNGGIYVYGSQPTISGNTITHNHCHGIYANAAAPLIENNEIDNTLDETHNCSFAGGAAIWLFDSPDASLGPAVNSATGPVIVGNLLQNNTQSGGEDAGGNGGAAIADWTDGAVIESNTIRDNVTAGEGAVFAYYGATITVVGNLIYRNSAYVNSGGLDLQVSGNGQMAGPFFGVIANNTIYGNQVTVKSSDPASAGSQVWLQGNLSQYVLVNNVIVGAEPGTGTLTCNNINLSYTPVVFDHNDIFSAAAGSPAYAGACPGQTGTYGNLSADPQFVNPGTGDFHVRPGSPVLDAGNNSAPIILSTDLAGSARILDATGLGYPVIDMGAYEAPGVADALVTTLTLTPSSFFPDGGFYNPVPTGPFTLTANLAAGTQIPTGPVTFYEDMKPIGTLPVDSFGSAILTPSIAPGLHAFLATYPGQGIFPAAVSVKFYVLFPMPTPSLTLNSSPNPSTLGSPVIFTLKAASSDGIVPSPITLTDTSSNTVLATLTPDSTGTATFITSSLSVGTHFITANFAGSNTDNSASASTTQIVMDGLATSTTLKSSLNPSTYGASVTFTAHVISPTTSAGTPAGTVSFTDGATLLGTGTLDTSGTAVISTAALTANAPGSSHLITATYNPSGTFGASSAQLNQVVNGLPTVVSIVPVPASATVGQAVILTTTVAPANPPGPAPVAGTVTYFQGSTTLGSATVLNGTASFSIASLPPGSDTITCTYNGSAIYASSNCAPITVTITGIPTTTILTATPNPAYQGQTVTITATVTATQTPTGPITFFDSMAVLGRGTLDASGQATLTTSSLAVGTHLLTASFPTNGSLIGSASVSVAEVILPSSFAIALAPTALSLPAGQAGAVTVTLSGIGDFSGPLTLSLGPLPTYVTASFTPGLVTLSGGDTATATLHLTTAQDPGPSATLHTPAHPNNPNTSRWPLLASTLLLLPLAAAGRKRLHSVLGSVLGLLLTAALLQTLTGCTTIRIPFHEVGVGTYAIPVIATDSNGNGRTATLTLTITP